VHDAVARKPLGDEKRREHRHHDAPPAHAQEAGEKADECAKQRVAYPPDIENHLQTLSERTKKERRGNIPRWRGNIPRLSFLAPRLCRLRRAS